MQKLVLALLISLPCCPMQDKTLVQQILTQEIIISCNRLPGDLSRKLAQTVLKNHSIIQYLLKNMTLASSCTLLGHASSVNSAEFNDTGDRIVTAGGRNAKIWNVQTGKCLRTLNGHLVWIYSAKFNAAGNRIVTASIDETAKIWDALTGECLATLKGHRDEVYSAVFNKAGNKVLTASKDKTAKIWEVTTGKCLATIALFLPVRSASFNEAEDKIVTVEDRTIKIWDMKTGMSLGSLIGHNDTVNSVNFNMDGDRIVSASKDKTTRMWDVQTGDCLLTFNANQAFVNSAVFNTAGDRILTASGDNTAKIWDASTGKCLATLEGHLDWVKSATFNKAADKIVTASDDETAMIWNLNDLHESNKFLFKTVSLIQAIILNAIYEVMVARRLVTIHGNKAFTQDEESIQQRINVNDITFDFNRYPNLQEHYNTIPALLRKLLDPLVTKQTT